VIKKVPKRDSVRFPKWALLPALSEISAETVRFVFQSRVLADPV
jgi:hypothetical protein